MEATSYSVREFADLCHVTPATVRRWIRRGRVRYDIEAGNYRISARGNESFALNEFRRIVGRGAAEWTPREIRQFTRWHELLDQLTWLLKVCHSSPSDIKKRRFRLDQLLVNYLQSPKPLSLRRLAKLFDPTALKRRRAITDDLKRGWYNETAFNYPPRASTLSFSYQDFEANKVSAATRFAFPSWRIVQAYYSIYFFTRMLALLKTSGFRLPEHAAAISTFNNGVRAPLEGSIWKFPLSISYVPHRRVERKVLPVSRLDHLRFQYSRHPRDGRSPSQLTNSIYTAFRRLGRKARHPSIYT